MCSTPAVAKLAMPRTPARTKASTVPMMMSKTRTPCSVKTGSPHPGRRGGRARVTSDCRPGSARGSSPRPSRGRGARSSGSPRRRARYSPGRHLAQAPGPPLDQGHAAVDVAQQPAVDRRGPGGASGWRAGARIGPGEELGPRRLGPGRLGSRGLVVWRTSGRGGGRADRRPVPPAGGLQAGDGALAWRRAGGRRCDRRRGWPALRAAEAGAPWLRRRVRGIEPVASAEATCRSMPVEPGRELRAPPGRSARRLPSPPRTWRTDPGRACRAGTRSRPAWARGRGRACRAWRRAGRRRRPTRSSRPRGPASGRRRSASGRGSSRPAGSFSAVARSPSRLAFSDRTSPCTRTSTSMVGVGRRPPALATTAGLRLGGEDFRAGHEAEAHHDGDARRDEPWDRPRPAKQVRRWRRGRHRHQGATLAERDARRAHGGPSPVSSGLDADAAHRLVGSGRHASVTTLAARR